MENNLNDIKNKNIPKTPDTEVVPFIQVLSENEKLLTEIKIECTELIIDSKIDFVESIENSSEFNNVKPTVVDTQHFPTSDPSHAIYASVNMEKHIGFK